MLAVMTETRFNSADLSAISSFYLLIEGIGGSDKQDQVKSILQYNVKKHWNLLLSSTSERDGVRRDMRIVTALHKFVS